MATALNGTSDVEHFHFSTVDCNSTMFRPQRSSSGTKICFSPPLAPAHEQIVLAKACEDAHLRAAMLRESLRLLSRVTHKLNLSAVCLEYQTGEGWGDAILGFARSEY